LQGYEVWNYYGDGVFGTFVTQGTAKVSPNELQRATKRRIDTERQNLIQARNQKQSEVDDLEARKNELAQQIRNLEEERQAMMSQMKVMAVSNDSMATELNSLRYYADTFRNLEKFGTIRKPALGKWQTGDMQSVTGHMSVDLRLDDRFAISAASIGLDKISKVLIFPRYYLENGDYRIEISEDKTSTTIILLKPEKFSLAQLVIALN
jgi:cell division protein FtsB